MISFIINLVEHVALRYNCHSGSAVRGERCVSRTHSSRSANVDSEQELAAQVQAFAGVAAGESRHNSASGAPTRIAVTGRAIGGALRVGPAVFAEPPVAAGVFAKGTGDAVASAARTVGLASWLWAEAAIVPMRRADFTGRTFQAVVSAHAVAALWASAAVDTVG